MESGGGLLTSVRPSRVNKAHRFNSSSFRRRQRRQILIRPIRFEPKGEPAAQIEGDD